MLDSSKNLEKTVKSWTSNNHKKALKPQVLGQPNIPKALHGINPRTIMGLTAWKRFSQIKRVNEPYCHACGAENCILDLHEDYDICYSSLTMRIRDYVPLCKSCHSFIHSGLLRVLVAQRAVSKERAKQVLERGFELCKASNIKVFSGTIQLARELGMGDVMVKSWTPPMNSEGWGQWKLIYEDTEYLGLTFEQWYKQYGAAVR